MTGLWLMQTAAERLAAAREGLDTPFLERLMGLVGIATMLAIAYGISFDRKRINWRMVGAGVLLQIALGVLVLKTPVGRGLFTFANNVVTGLLGFQERGARFVFGNLVQNEVP
ncbi:MAG: Na+ dependent nucleoside transporter N-terminal domain-containing protein, partial [Gemmatimonadales bacterium]